MKRDFRLETLGFRLVALVFFIAAPSAVALTENPYNGIVGRNAFALKPPTPAVVAAPPVVAPPGIELQGITTILGRPQVLLKIKLPPKPPEPAKDQSFVLDVGQREGEVEVVAIDMVGGTVRLKNQGNDLALNMKDNAAKPQAGPALASPIAPPIAGGIPTPAMGGTPGGGASVTTMGGGSAGVPTLPTRSLRSNPTGGAGGASVTPQNNPNDARNLPLEAQHALIEIERERTKGTKFPPLPQITPGPSAPGN